MGELLRENILMKYLYSSLYVNGKKSINKKHKVSRKIIAPASDECKRVKTQNITSLESPLYHL